MLSRNFLSFLEEKLSHHNHSQIRIKSTSPVSGGSINDAYRLDGGDVQFFVKVNSASRYPGMFEAEAKGLSLLKSAGEIEVPEVIEYGEKDGLSFLLLNHIHSARKKSNFWQEFAEKLAALHRHSHEDFGLDHDNYIGSLRQYNNRHSSWIEFFIQERLNVQIEMAGNSGLMSKSDVDSFEMLFNRLPSIFPVEPPSLIHGDLWGGNYMSGAEGQPVIIDPAVYYGNREMDLGMSKLFGGFDQEFYQAYQSTFPMAPGWQERLEICNLYPLMVHVNLFGSGYLGSVRSILQRF